MLTQSPSAPGPHALPVLRAILATPATGFSAAVLVFMLLAAISAPLIVNDPMVMDPLTRLKSPGTEFWFGTDRLGRNVFDRTLYGARISLLVGTCVAVLTLSSGLLIGVLAGFIPALDAVLMRLTDALMAIPNVLLAIALMAMFGSSVINVIIAISIAELPGVIRLVRSVVLGQRQQLYVEAAIASGTRLPKLLGRHILPNTMAPLLVQGSLVFASAIITEAILSFLGAGTPPEIASWGNIVAEGRNVFVIAPWVIFFPGACLALVVLSINLLGDQMRDVLDPRLAQ